MSDEVQVWLDEDERFPDVLIVDPPTGSYIGERRMVTVSQAALDRWRKAIAEYDAVQDEMGAARAAAPVPEPGSPFIGGSVVPPATS